MKLRSLTPIGYLVTLIALLLLAQGNVIADEWAPNPGGRVGQRGASFAGGGWRREPARGLRRESRTGGACGTFTDTKLTRFTQFNQP